MEAMDSPQSHSQTELAPTQIRAIAKAKKLGKEVVLHHPEIAEDYRANMNQKEIALKYGLHKGTTIKIAREAVRHALLELIPDIEEREKLREAIILTTSQKIGQTSYKKKRGIHALDSEEKRLVARESNILQGKMPWKGEAYEINTGLDELGYCFMLLSHPKLQNGRRLMNGAYEFIANELNQIFHRGESVRTALGVRLFKYSYTLTNKKSASKNK